MKDGAKRRGTKRKRILLGLLAVVLIPVLWEAIVRLTSPWTAVKVIHDSSIGDDSAPSDGVRLFVWNIAHGRGPVYVSNWKGGDREVREERLEAIAAEIRKASADVVILNEIDFEANWDRGVNQAAVIAEKAGYPWRVEVRNIDAGFPGVRFAFGDAVLSRIPVSETSRLPLPYYSLKEKILAGAKISAVVTLELADGGVLHIVPVHLEHRSEEVRVGSARAIIERCGSLNGPVIIAGDFNSTLPALPNSSLDPQGENAMRVFRKESEFRALRGADATSRQYTFPTTGPNRLIDWVLAGKGAKVTSVEVLHPELSDHLPLKAEVEIGGEITRAGQN